MLAGDAKKDKHENFAEGKQVKLGSQTYLVESMAEGMRKTAEYILVNYPQVQNRLDDSGIAKWITRDRKQAGKKEGYFRSGKQVRTDKGEFWIGTASNLRTKKGQMENLCELAGVEKNKISWYEAAGQQVFQW